MTAPLTRRKGTEGCSSPTSVAPVAFPVAIYFFIIAGLPGMLICGLLWAGFRASVRRARPGGADPADRPAGS